MNLTEELVRVVTEVDNIDRKYKRMRSYSNQNTFDLWVKFSIKFKKKYY